MGVCINILCVALFFHLTLLRLRVFFFFFFISVPNSDYSRIRKLPVNFVSEPVQCQSCFSGFVT